MFRILVGQGLCSCRGGSYCCYKQRYRKLSVCRSCRGRQLLLPNAAKRLYKSNRKLSVCRSCRRLMLLLHGNRKLLVCRSCRGGQLLLPVTAIVTKNAFCAGKTTRRKQVHSHNNLAQNWPIVASARMGRFAALRATARHTPQAVCTPRGESANAERRDIHNKDKNMG